MRVTESALVGERRQDPRLARLCEIEQPRPAGAEPVGQEVPAGWHLLLGVMRMRARLAHRHGRHDFAVGR